MNKPMDIVDLYKSVLDVAGLSADDEGFVSVKMDKDKSPALMNGKRIVLPTQNQLSNTDHTNRVIFHPLVENVLHGESEIIARLRSALNVRLNYTFAAIGSQLLQIGASIAEHNKLNPNQSEFLSIVKDIDEKMMSTFGKIMVAAIKKNPERCFINIFLKRKAIVNKVTYSRGGVVTFPMLDELLKDDDECFGVKMRVKDKLGITELFKYILPGCETPEIYNRGSNSNIAPFLDALMKTTMGVASKFNDVLELFGPKIDSYEDLIFNADWVETFDNLDVMQPQTRLIPMQAGNEGKPKAQEEMQSTAGMPALVYPPQQSQPAPPVIQQPQVYQPQAYQQPPPPQMYQNGQQYGYQPQPVQQPPAPLTENGLIDFRASMARRPDLQPMLHAQAFNVGARPQMQQPQNQMPVWAVQPQNNYPNQTMGFMGGSPMGGGMQNPNQFNTWNGTTL